MRDVCVIALAPCIPADNKAFRIVDLVSRYALGCVPSLILYRPVSDVV